MSERKFVTNPAAKAMRQARLDGMTFIEIATTFRVSIATACRYADPEGHGQKQLEYNKARWRRQKEEAKK